MVFIKLPETDILWSALQNSGHYLIFLLLSIAFLSILGKAFPGRPKANICWTVLVLSVFGIFIELIQLTQPDRSTTIADLLRNTSGIISGAFLYTACSLVRRKIAIPLVLITFAAAVFTNTTSLTLLGYQLLKSELPHIVSFDDYFVESYIDTIGGAKVAVVEASFIPANEPYLQANFAEQRFSGVVFRHTGGPWPASGELVIEIFNPNNTDHELHLRIHDVNHDNTYSDRFNASFTLTPGNNQLQFDLKQIQAMSDGANRKMNLNDIQEMQFFSQQETFSVFFQSIMLANYSQ